MIRVSAQRTLLLSLLFVALACEQTEKEEAETSASAGTLEIDACDPEYSGESTCGAEVGASIATAQTNIASVNENYAPGALAIDGQGSNLTLEGSSDSENPCQENGVDLTFEACQPNLLKTYLSIGRMPLETAEEVLLQAKSLMEEHLQTGELSGTFNFEDHEEVEGGEEHPEDEDEHVESEIEYKIVSSSDFELIVRMSEIHIFFDLSGNQIDMTMWMPEEDGSHKEGISEARIVFDEESDDEWEVTNKMAFTSCPAQGDGPRVIAVDIQRNSGVWQGKAMLYDTGGPTICETENHPGQSGWYTNFVGDDDVTTASVYFFPMDKDPRELDDVEAYNLPAICSNLPQHQFCSAATACESVTVTAQLCTGCQNNTITENCNCISQQSCAAAMGMGLTDSDFALNNNGGQQQGGGWLPDDLSQNINPYCISGNDVPTWGGACESTNALISTPTYSDVSRWIDPASDLRDADPCFPTSLSDKETCQTDFSL